MNLSIALAGREVNALCGGSALGSQRLDQPYQRLEQTLSGKEPEDVGRARQGQECLHRAVAEEKIENYEHGQEDDA